MKWRVKAAVSLTFLSNFYCPCYRSICHPLDHETGATDKTFEVKYY